MKVFTRFILAWSVVLFFSATVLAQQWWSVGTAGFSTGEADYTSIAIDGNGTPYVAFSDYDNSHKATVMKYSGTSWETVGTADFSAGEADNTCIAIDGDGTPYVAYTDYGNSYKATVMKYYGGSWQVVGNAGFSADQAWYMSLAIDGSGTPYVAYLDYGNSHQASVMKYTGVGGSGWENVGSAGFSVATGQAQFTCIAIDRSGTPYVAYQDWSLSSEPATVMKYTGAGDTGWELVGSADFSAGGASNISIAINRSGTPYVAYTDEANSSKATVMKYTGNGASGWENVGSAGFSDGGANYTSIAIDGSGTPYVAYEDAGHSSRATVKKYNGTTWETVGTAGFSVGASYNTSIAVAPNGIPVVVYSDAGISWEASAKKYSVNQDDPLPVQATSFVAKADVGSVSLSWKTQSEINNAGFNVLRQDSHAGPFNLIAGCAGDKELVGLGTSASGRSYSFTDRKVTAGAVYNYKIQSVSTNGTTEDLVTLPITVKAAAVPKEYALHQNYPNPFNPATVISYDLPKPSHVTLMVYDELDRRVATLVNDNKDAGKYKVVFDATRLPSGVYFYSLNAGTYHDIKKLLLLK